MATRKPTKKKATKKASKKSAPRKRAARGADQRVQATDAETVARLEGTAKRIHATIMKGGKPDLALPVRSLSNVRYSGDKGYLEIGRQRKVRTLSVNTVKNFARPCA